MTRKPTHSFDSLTSTGVDILPINSLIYIEEGVGGKPMIIKLKDKTSLTGSSTVQDLLNLTTQWIEVAGGGLIRQNPNTLTEDFELEDGFSGVVTNMSIDDGVTLTIPDGSILTVV